MDPSTVNLPHNLTAIVGPNGCGKSNVIDAVRWVMGESSAKHLRGESMTDVIFNGSATRKPIGQASIELEFDNSDGTLVGELGAFSEIAIKRTVSRDGQSNYYLNGTRCRRKDITDIFLGTGLGPRSYAIIEQGTISRLIEAKPEELRVFIEEAAGISKYKERRRETENRMQRTRENLDRLGDVREELDRQLQHLNRQAQTAERYKNLKEEERLYKAQLQVLRWLLLEENVQQHSADIRTLELKREAQLTEQISIEAALEIHHSEAQQLNENFNRVQGEFYSLGADVARLEQQIRHQKQREQDVQRNLADVSSSLEQVSSHLLTDHRQMTSLDEEILSLEPELELLQSTQDEMSEHLLQAEENMQHWQHDWDQFNASSSAISQKAQVEQSRIEQLEQAIRRGRERITRLLEERQGLHDPDLEASVQVLEETLERARDALLEQEEALAAQRQDIEQQRQHNQSLSKTLDQQKTVLQGKKGQLTSLEALQEAAMGSSGAVLNQWLKAHSLDSAPRLIDQITVLAGWEVALETVLSSHLHALCLNKVAQLRDGIGTLLANASFVSAEGIDAASITADISTGIEAPRLLQFVQGHAAALQILQGIYAVENLNDAFDLQHRLQGSESVVTRDGFWLGPNWLRLQKEENKSAGVLARKQQIEQIKNDIAEQEAQLGESTERLEAGRLRLLDGEARRETLSQELTLANRKIADIKAQLSAKEVRLEQFSLRRQRLERELQEIQQQLENDQDTVNQSRVILQEALDGMAESTLRREDLLSQRDQRRSVLDEARHSARIHKDNAHRLALQIRAIKTQRDSMVMALERLREQQRQLEQRRDQLLESVQNNDEPIDLLQASLEDRLEQRLQVEEKLATARRLLEDVESQRQTLEKRRVAAEQAIQSCRTELEKKRIEQQAFAMRQSAALEHLQELGADLQSLRETLPADANEAAWEAELESLASKISRLGAINLAAIDEYHTEMERKSYLDRQHADLIEALETLEAAIRKIDKETRNRFKETFEQVNSGLQELFPKVFGGGHAYLELTGEDLLDTGVAIMARPPGKRNSTIHLLSGGEKALTAIALVFSIFRLNPAPFCMLDEVDAPLDDANVGRFCRLVKEMSKNVQFIYISHNKVAMEMAQVLMGVTMQEPGVSRLVSVNIDEATALAAL